MRKVFIFILLIATYLEVGKGASKRAVFDLVPQDSSYRHRGNVLKLVNLKQTLEMMTNVGKWRSLIKQNFRIKLQRHRMTNKMTNYQPQHDMRMNRLYWLSMFINWILKLKKQSSGWTNFNRSKKYIIRDRTNLSAPQTILVSGGTTWSKLCCMVCRRSKKVVRPRCHFVNRRCPFLQKVYF